MTKGAGLDDTEDRRRRMLARADRARAKGRARVAIRLYRRVLEAAPQDPGIHRKLAPLLARRRLRDEAWQSFQIACDALAERGFDDRAAGLLREAVTLLPRHPEAWQRLGAIEASRGRSVDARLVLFEGRRRFRGRRNRAAARRLMELANRIDPHQPDVLFDLARLRRQTGDRAGACRMLEELMTTHPGAAPSARRALFVARPGARTLWAWIGSRTPSLYPT